MNFQVSILKVKKKMLRPGLLNLVLFDALDLIILYCSS